MFRILQTALPELYEKIGGEQDLFLPVKTAGKTNFALWRQGVQADLAAVKTVVSPKDVFFPQSESLYACSRTGGRLEITPQERCSSPFVVLGIRPCDVEALTVLDRVFLSPPVDSFYAARRAHGILVSLACSRPGASCFCGSFGIDSAEPQGDVAAWMAGDYLYWEPRTDSGRALTDSLSGLLEPWGEEEVEAEKKAIRAIMDRLPLRDLSLKGWGAEAARTRFDSPLWEELSQACIGCGTCTFVCPTCQCYDIKDFDTGHGITRYRCWDSCMYSDFTMMAAGNNRTTQMQRYRQRFMHKLAYYPANYEGAFSCVGCGRCVEKCPSHLNIVKVIQAFGKEEA